MPQLASNWPDKSLDMQVRIKSPLIDLEPQESGQQGGTLYESDRERLSEETLSISKGQKRCDSRLTVNHSSAYSVKADKKFYIICALALGDGSIWKPRNSEKAILDIAHHIKHKDYVDYKKFILDSIGISCSVAVKNRKGNIQYRVSTNSNYLIYCVYRTLYLNKNKIFTEEMVRNFGVWALAVLWMDDGCLYWKKNHVGYSREGSISSHSFGKEGNERMAKWLLNKFGIETRITEDKRKSEEYRYYLKLKQSEVDKLTSIVSPIVNEIPSMRYKVDRPNPNLNIWRQRVS